MGTNLVITALRWYRKFANSVSGSAGAAAPRADLPRPDTAGSDEPLSGARRGAAPSLVLLAA